MWGTHACQRTIVAVQVHCVRYACRSEDNSCCTGTCVWSIHAGQRTIGVVQAHVCGVYMQVSRQLVLLLGFISPSFMKQDLSLA